MTQLNISADCSIEDHPPDQAQVLVEDIYENVSSPLERGKHNVIDNRGYSYILFKRKTNVSVHWWCAGLTVEWSKKWTICLLEDQMNILTHWNHAL